MSVVALRSALEVALNAMSPALATNWENTPYTPIPGTAYQIVHLLTAKPDNPEMTGNMHTEVGIMQITLMYPQEVGPVTAETRAELIRSTFKRGYTFTSGSVKVHISATPEIAPGYNDEDRYCKPVKIYFHSHIF